MKNTNPLPCKVVMIATDMITYSFRFPIGEDTLGNPQHLYFVSEQEANKGDYIIYTSPSGKKGIYQVREKDPSGYICTYEPIKPLFHEARKIVATTDSSLGLPLIGQPFIEAYIKAQGKIEEVNVEVDYKPNDLGEGSDYYVKKIKTRPDGTVIIHQSKTYTREEVEKKLDDAIMYGYRTCNAGGNINKDQWISENL